MSINLQKKMVPNGISQFTSATDANDFLILILIAELKLILSALRLHKISCEGNYLSIHSVFKINSLHAFSVVCGEKV